MISEVLRTGKENALTMADLERKTGRNRRDIQKMIAEERAGGQLILSSTKGRGGYFLPGNAGELREYVRSMEARARATFRACTAARRALKAMEAAEQGGQLSLAENSLDGPPTGWEGAGE